MPDQKNQDQLREFITALIAFQKQMPVIPKDKTASVSVKGGGSYTYNYADLGDIIPVVMPLLGEHGLVHTCTSHRTTEGFILTGHLMHQAGHIMTADLPLFGTRFQEIGGSITYGRRYLLCLQTGIITDEDDDARGVNQAPRTTGQPATPEQAPVPPDRRITRSQVEEIMGYELSDSSLGQIIEVACRKAVTGFDYLTREDGDKVLTYLDPTRNHQ